MNTLGLIYFVLCIAFIGLSVMAYKKKNIGIFVFVLVLIYYYFYLAQYYFKSEFGGMTGPSPMDQGYFYPIDQGLMDQGGKIKPDTVVIIFAPWCGHCKRSMPDFEESVDRGNGKVVMVNSEEEKELADKLMNETGSNGFPTIAKGFGTGKPIVYEGDSRTADAILAFQSS